jgi:elongation factor G
VLGAGVLAGFPVVDLKVTLIDAAYHDTDSSPLAFEIAARTALKEALRAAVPILLEPIMNVEVVTSEEFSASIVGDFRSRRGTIQSQEMRDDAKAIYATVPLATLLGYQRSLDALSRGQATFEMSYSHYAPVPMPDDDGPFAPAIGLRA